MLISIVAAVDGTVVGHVAVSPVATAAGIVGAGIGPIAVMESHRRKGVAAELMRAALDATRAAGFGWVVVLGSPKYYGRFGFRPASEFGLSDEYTNGSPAFQAMELVPDAMPVGAGLVKYSEEFNSLGQSENEPERCVQNDGAGVIFRCRTNISGLRDGSIKREDDMARSWIVAMVLATFVASAVAEDFNAETAQKAVVQIRIKNGNEILGHGTGFFVTEDGKLLTNYHVISSVIEEGNQATAFFMDGNKTERPINLWRAWPEYDLAMVYLEDRKDTERFSLLSLAKVSPKVGNTVWTFGYPIDHNMTGSMTSGIVSGLRSLTELRTLVPDIETRYDTKATWLQTDCALNPGNSGGPLMDRKGEVVGVNTWLSRKGDRLNFSLNVDCINQLMKNLPKEPTKFQNVASMPEVQRNIPGQKIAGDQKPRKAPVRLPSINITPMPTKHDLKPAQVIQMARLLKAGFSKECEACKGTGYVEVEVRKRNQGSTINRPTITTERRDCTSCQRGRIVAKPDVQLRLTKTWMAGIAGMEVETAQNRDTWRQAIDESVEALRSDWRGGRSLHAASILELNSKNVDRTFPVCVFGFVAAKAQAENQERFAIYLPDRDIVVVAVNPVSQDRPETFDFVYATGAISDIIDLETGRLVVIQNGLVLTMEAMTKRR